MGIFRMFKNVVQENAIDYGSYKGPEAAKKMAVLIVSLLDAHQAGTEKEESIETLRSFAEPIRNAIRHWDYLSQQYPDNFTPQSLMKISQLLYEATKEPKLD